MKEYDMGAIVFDPQTIGNWQETPWYFQLIGYPKQRRKINHRLDRSKFLWEYKDV